MSAGLISTADDFNTTLKSLVDTLSVKKWSKRMQKTDAPKDIACSLDIIDSQLMDFAPKIVESPSSALVASISSSSLTSSASSAISQNSPNGHPKKTIMEMPYLQIFYETFQITLVRQEHVKMIRYTEDQSQVSPSSTNFRVIIPEEAILTKELLLPSRPTLKATMMPVYPQLGDVVMESKIFSSSISSPSMMTPSSNTISLSRPRVVSMKKHALAPTHIYIAYSGSTMIRCYGSICQGDFLVYDSINSQQVYGIAEEDLQIELMGQIVGIALVSGSEKDTQKKGHLVPALIFYPDEAWLSKIPSPDLAQHATHQDDQEASGILGIDGDINTHRLNQLQLEYRRRRGTESKMAHDPFTSNEFASLIAIPDLLDGPNVTSYSVREGVQNYPKNTLPEKASITSMTSHSSGKLASPTKTRWPFYIWCLLGFGGSVIVFALILLGLYLGGLLGHRGKVVFVDVPIESNQTSANNLPCLLSENQLSSLCNFPEATSFDWSCDDATAAVVTSDVPSTYGSDRVLSLNPKGKTLRCQKFISTTSTKEITKVASGDKAMISSRFIAENEAQFKSNISGKTYFYSTYIKSNGISSSSLSVALSILLTPSSAVCQTTGPINASNKQWQLLEISCVVPNATTSFLLVLDVIRSETQSEQPSPPSPKVPSPPPSPSPSPSPSPTSPLVPIPPTSSPTTSPPLISLPTTSPPPTSLPTTSLPPTSSPEISPIISPSPPSPSPSIGSIIISPPSTNNSSPFTDAASISPAPSLVLAGFSSPAALSYSSNPSVPINMFPFIEPSPPSFSSPTSLSSFLTSASSSIESPYSDHRFHSGLTAKGNTSTVIVYIDMLWLSSNSSITTHLPH